MARVGFEHMRRPPDGQSRTDATVGLRVLGWAPPLALSKSACWGSPDSTLEKQSSCNSAHHYVRKLCFSTVQSLR